MSLLAERIKNLSDILLGNPDSSVLTAIGSEHMGFIRLSLTDRQLDPFTLRCELSRIADNIHQDLFGSCYISRNAGHLDLFFHDKFYATTLNIIRLHGSDLIDHRRDQHRLSDDIHFARLQLGHIQHIIYQRQQIISCTLGLAQPFPDLAPLSLIINVSHDQMIHADQTVQRRTDLMAHIGKKLPL